MISNNFQSTAQISVYSEVLHLNSVETVSRIESDCQANRQEVYSRASCQSSNVEGILLVSAFRQTRPLL